MTLSDELDDDIDTMDDDMIEEDDEAKPAPDGTVLRFVSLPITNETRLTIGAQLSKLILEEKQVYDNHKAAAATANSELKRIKLKRQELAEQHEHGHRSTKVKTHAHHDANRLVVYYTCAEDAHPDFDNGARVHGLGDAPDGERPMTDEERHDALNPTLPGVTAKPVTTAPDPETRETLLDPPTTDETGAELDQAVAEAAANPPAPTTPKGKKAGPASGKAKGKKATPARKGSNGTHAHP